MAALSFDREKSAKLQCAVRHVTMQMEFDTTTYQYRVEFVGLDPEAGAFTGRYMKHRSGVA